MAFLAPSAVGPRPHRIRTSNPVVTITPSRPHHLTHPHATAVQPNRVRKQQTPLPRARPRTPAHVIDSRVASRHEAHHWIVVKSHSRRLFERAAVAQVDITRKLEARNSKGALHRWVLREIASPHADNSRYVVLESFRRADIENAETDPTSASVTRRWLSAVERVGPSVDAIDMSTHRYSDVFTTKSHDVVFDPSSNLVVIETFKVKSAPSHVNAVIHALRAKAERSVSVGQCLEFSVLQSWSQPSTIKVVQVHQDPDALNHYVQAFDKKFMHSLSPHLAGARRSRHVFEPVVFA